eukprot:3949679-Alexandrium_andersonii.AAC.1
MSLHASSVGSWRAQKTAKKNNAREKRTQARKPTNQAPGAGAAHRSTPGSPARRYKTIAHAPHTRGWERRI